MTPKTKTITATCIILATATAIYLTGTEPALSPEIDGVAYSSYAALIVADCGTETEPGLQHLSAHERETARCRPDTRAYECAAIRIPEGTPIESVTSWRIVNKPRLLASHPCRSDACLIDMEECNGQPSIMGHVERETSAEVWVRYFGICVGAKCRCAGNCVSGAPSVVESGSSEWREGFCFVHPTDRECAGSTGDELVINPPKEQKR